MNWKVLAGIIIIVIAGIGFNIWKDDMDVQRSIEREKLEFQKKQYDDEQAEKDKVDRVKTLNETLLGICLDGATDKYWSYVKLNGTEVAGKPGTYNAYQSVWDEAAKQQKAAEDKCFKQYK